MKTFFTGEKLSPGMKTKCSTEVVYFVQAEEPARERY